jgi:hypothetical protein
MTAAGSTIPEGARLVHIGPHKTGSTAIQMALFQAADQLAEHGVAYPSIGAYRPRRAGWSLGIGGRPSGTEKPPIELWERFVAKVNATDVPRICVSNEDFGRAIPKQVARLVQDLGGDRVRVLSVVRRFDRYLPSQWQQRVRSGDTRSYDEWLRVVLDSDDADHQWERSNVWYAHDVKALVERWLAEVEPEHYTVIISDEADRSLIPHTFETMLGLPQGFIVPDPTWSNRGLNWTETELLRHVNALLEQRGVRRSDRRLLLWAGVHRALQERPEPSGPKSPPLPDWAADRVRALGEQRVEDLYHLGDRGVRLVGDPEAMRMPDDVATAAPPFPAPPIDMETAALTLASALIAIPLESIEV